MSRITYTAAETWSIFAGGLIIGIVLTSFFWAYITIPDEVKTLKEEAKSADSLSLEKPVEFINFCEELDGKAEWDSAGYRSCSLESTNDKEVLVMSVFCKKFDLNMSYGSYGVRCENHAKK